MRTGSGLGMFRTPCKTCLIIQRGSRNGGIRTCLALITVTEVGTADSSYYLPFSIRPRRFASPSVHSAQSALAMPDVFPDACIRRNNAAPAFSAVLMPTLGLAHGTRHQLAPPHRHVIETNALSSQPAPVMRVPRKIMGTCSSFTSPL